MPEIADYRLVGQVINAQCRIPSDSGEWWGKMLTNIALAVGPGEASEVKYVTASYSSDDDYEIAVFTDSLLILGEARSGFEGDTEISVDAYSLNEIVSVKLDAPTSFFDGGFRSDWPGRYSVQISHPQAGSVSLPFDKTQSNFADEQLADLVPKLLDAVRRRG